MGKKAHSKSTFQDEWFTNKKFADWIGKTNKLPEARCLVCEKSIDISLMEVSALDYHPTCAKHQKNLKDSEGMDIRSMFNKKSQQSTAAKHETTSNQETTTKQVVTGTAKQGSIHAFTQKENFLNAEILWCLRMVLAHDSYNSCCDLSKLFGRMFPDSDVEKAFTLGKTKCRYTMLYGIAPKFKRELIFDITSSPFYSVTFDESMNSELQMCQMDVGIQF